MAYTENQISNELLKHLSNIETLYKKDLIDRKGLTSDTHELYAEVISKELLLNLNVFHNIKSITRRSSYCKSSHKKVEINLESNRSEEIFAKRITGLAFKDLGLVLDYQTPLKDVQNDNAGKIDLVSYKKEDNIFYLLELKYIGNEKDSFLHALLEVYTYFKTIDQQKLIADYSKDSSILRNNNLLLKDNNIKIIPALLLAEECKAYKEFDDMQDGNRPITKALTLALGIKTFTIDFDIYEYLI